jgi:hypothetical protein
MDVHLKELLEYMDQGQVPMSELADALPNDKEQLVVAQLLQIDPAVADNILVELRVTRPDDRTLLAAASLVARRLSDERRQYWSGVLAEYGLNGSPAEQEASA